MQVLLEPLGVQLHSQRDLDLDSAEETGLTFVENALLKAQHAAQHSGWAAIADDSGLVVPCLNGEPGIYSARYAGEQGDDKANNDKLVATLQSRGFFDARQPPVAAFFYCALVYIEHASDPTPCIATAAWHGSIVDTARGTEGFGYDPYFLVDHRTSAELAKEEKNSISHRGQASQNLLKQLHARFA